MKVCKFCAGKSLKFPKAHIIPAALFEDIKSGLPLKIISPGEFVKNTHDGVYDTNVWCQSCEDQYGRFDNYGVKVLRTPLQNFDQVVEGTEIVGLAIDLQDPFQLQKFFISMLWRAHASENSMFSQVGLGKYEEEARNILMSNSALCTDNFEIVVSYPRDGIRVITNPFRYKLGGVNFYKFYLGRFEVLIKCDKQKLPSQLRFAKLDESGRLRVPITTFDYPSTNFLEKPPLKLKKHLTALRERL